MEYSKDSGIQRTESLAAIPGGGMVKTLFLQKVRLFLNSGIIINDKMKNKKIYAALAILGMSLGLFYSCKPGKKEEKTDIISVSILPEKYLVNKIAGEKYEVNVLIPPGASPASYEPSPKQIADLEQSKLYFRIGHILFEKIWINRMADQNSHIEIIDLSEGMDLMILAEHEHTSEENDPDSYHHISAETDDHHLENPDPHIWMSPKKMIRISENLLNGMIKVYPSDSSLFRKNYLSLLTEIKSIDSLFSSDSILLSGLNFFIYHPALGYLANDYSMVQHVLEVEGKEPGPAHIAAMVDEAKKNNIKFIFVQKQFNQDNAKSLAKEINAEVINIDPLDVDWPGQLRFIHKVLTTK